MNACYILRNARGLTQQNLAKLTHLSTIDISRIEHNNTSVLVFKLQQVASFFNVPYELFIRNDLEKISAFAPCIITPSSQRIKSPNSSYY